jgi:N-acylneuraminate cytidylyltransferase
MKKTKVVALIPARGGSKGIPLKNITTIMIENGKDISLLENSIKRLQPLMFQYIHELWVSTDSEKISEHVMKKFPVSREGEYLPLIHLRSPESATDEASTESLLFEFLEEQELENNDILVTVQCTSPFLDPEVLTEAILKVYSGEYQSAVSVTKTHRFFWTKRRHSEEGMALNYDPKHRPRRQDLKEEFFIENGSFYVTRCGNLRASGTRLPDRVYLAVQKEEYTHVEIDTLEDLEVARKLMESKGKTK